MQSTGSAAANNSNNYGSASGPTLYDNGHNGASGASSAEYADSTKQQRKPTASTESAEPEQKYTTEQLEFVRRIQQCTDYYKILGVKKDCSEEDIKKAFRKLSKQLHPDKNHAPGAEDAFKELKKCYDVLNDAEKRRRYDESLKEYTVEQLELVKRIQRCMNLYEVLGVEKDCDQDDLVKAYRELAPKLHPDNNHAPGAERAYFVVVYCFSVLNDAEKRQRYDQSQTKSQSESESEQTHEDSYQGRPNTPTGQKTKPTVRIPFPDVPPQLLVVLTPVLLCCLVPILSVLLQMPLLRDKPFSLSKTDQYVQAKKTSKTDVRYFVKKDFQREYRGSIKRLEEQVEDEYTTTISNLRTNCFTERNEKENMLWRARTFGDSILHEKAQNLNTPTCDILKSYVLGT